ncbi:hypothetical protein Q4I28_000856 [Leishmania naiffi]|uniref:Uncharacterized protein n=1 Tax=Leishmania naiffi TaxID=5678 RepID=A0AAW3C935_9TRYP
MSDEREQAIALLRDLRATATPKFVDSGEALTYLVYKDEALEKAIAFLSPAYVKTTPENMRSLCVNHERLANAAIERIFDAHTHVLRSKLAEAEKAADMWKRVALFRGAEEGNSVRHITSAEPALCAPGRVSVSSQVCSTQVDVAATESKTSVPPCALVCEAVREWLADWNLKAQCLVNEKVELWCLSQRCLITHLRINRHEHEVGRPFFGGSLKVLGRRSSARPASRKINNARVGNRKASCMESGEESEQGAFTPTVDAPGENLVKSSAVSSLHAAASSASAPSLPKPGTHLPRGAPSDSPLYVMQTIFLKGRTTQLSGNQQTSTSGSPVGPLSHLPRI